MLPGATYKVKTPLSDHALYITINDVVLNPGTEHEIRRPFEIFINSKAMEHFQWIVALTRIISAAVSYTHLDVYKRQGMGYLGLGSTLTLLGMKYGSPESLAFTEKVTRELALTGWRTALELALEKGPAPILEQDFTITAAMLHQRPELVRDGIQEGDRVKGKVLHCLLYTSRCV